MFSQKKKEIHGIYVIKVKLHIHLPLLIQKHYIYKPILAYEPDCLAPYFSDLY
jgi:hypothetical protein